STCGAETDGGRASTRIAPGALLAFCALSRAVMVKRICPSRPRTAEAGKRKCHLPSAGGGVTGETSRGVPAATSLANSRSETEATPLPVSVPETAISTAGAPLPPANQIWPSSPTVPLVKSAIAPICGGEWLITPTHSPKLQISPGAQPAAQLPESATHTPPSEQSEPSRQSVCAAQFPCAAGLQATSV